MNRGIGSVYRQKGRSTWWISYWHAGKRYSESAETENKKEATDKLRTRIGEITSGKFCLKADKVTLADLKQLVIDDYAANGLRSVDRVEDAFLHLEKRLFAVPAILIPRKLSRYIADRKADGAAAASIRYELRVLGRGYRLAARDGLLAQVPVFPSIKVSNARQGFVTDENMDAIESHLGASRRREHLRPVARFAFLTGWRLSEVTGLRWSQIDQENGIARLESEQTKNGEAREFPIHALPELADVVKAQRERTEAWQREHGEIVVNVFWRPGWKDGRRSARPLADFRGAWKAACKKAGLPDTLFHDLRRSAVRRMELAGVPRSTAMALTGHQTEDVYRRYAIVAKADLEAGVAKIAALRGR